MRFLLHPTYFPNIATFAVIAQNEVCWEMEDNYQKQTYRNRCYICTDKGRHLLNIPIKHVGGDQGRQKFKEVLIENEYHWQRDHWRTLQTAYRTSPFFEFYEDDLAPLYGKPHKFLLDFNLQTISTICELLQIEMPVARTLTFEKEPKDLKDTRFLVNAKKDITAVQENYIQVFGDRHGFIKNTSILDLLFNEGPNALNYLQQQELGFLNR
jgi:hypothetical protein